MITIIFRDGHWGRLYPPDTENQDDHTIEHGQQFIPALTTKEQMMLADEATSPLLQLHILTNKKPHA